VVRANPITSSRENDGRHNGRDIDNLNECEQRVISQYAVTQKQSAGSEPDQPS
jgi:hypothetical protein